ncbi:MAG: transposase [Pseudomonadales bacterium]
MTTPRKILVDNCTPLFYHLISRCVRRSFLCGRDPLTKRNYNHRKAWLKERMYELGRYFSVDLYAYSIMDNHFHMVVYYDPNESNRWSDDEVADRWLSLCPVRLADGTIDVVAQAVKRSVLIEDNDALAHARRQLGSLSMFMKFLKQPIARRANAEDGCTGHFFEQRFYSGALLDENAALAAMAYVDLNPVRAQIANSIEACRNSSISDRLSVQVNSRERLDAYLAPLASGINKKQSQTSTTLKSYVLLLRHLTKSATPSGREISESWTSRMELMRSLQRAYGSKDKLELWIRNRKLRFLERPMAA